MTLIEKFENVELNLSECIYESIGIEASKQCEKIADDFAIGFAEWVVKTNAFLDYGYDEALQIYKTEKGI